MLYYFFSLTDRQLKHVRGGGPISDEYHNGGCWRVYMSSWELYWVLTPVCMAHSPIW